ncbi:hypothetical protein A1351_01800 [Methylosinus sp. R-45379]|jgi:hypothetical protein|nr:hypothetical protein A1351_01800 [Methylosinus sp. R-45379]
MDKFALWPKGIARLLIVGLLAWALVLPGMAVAALSAVEPGVVAAEAGHCATSGGADGHRHSPGPHFSCSCCIPCRAGQIDGPTGFLSVLPAGAVLSFRAAEIVLGDESRMVEPSSPAGWISSWSQRAPPRFFSIPLPPALEA